MRILLILVALAILLFLCILTAYRVPLPTSLHGSRDRIAAVTAGLVGLGGLATLVLYLIGSLRRSARALDPVLEPLGIVGSGYAGFGRRYTGILEGWEIEVRYFPAHGMRAGRLDLAVEGEWSTRMAVGWQRPLLDCRDCPRLNLGKDLLYTVYAQDDRAARALLADPAARAALDRLMDARGGAALYVQPERLWFRVRPWRMEGAPIERWLQDLVCLAQARS